MSEFSLFVGIDVSKDWLDLCCFSPSSGQINLSQIDNTSEAIRSYVESLNHQVEQVLFCLEHTGHYSNVFLEVSSALNLTSWIEHPLQIKRSQGMQRGKTDAQDAERIAMYAYRFQDKAVFYQPSSQQITELKRLQSKRDLLVKMQGQIRQALTDKNDKDFKASVKAIAKDIETIEKKIKKVIASDSTLANQDELLQSIPGIGSVLSVTLITITEGFTSFNDSRKLACYAGIAPFPYRSGKSIRYRDRVSKLGNQRLKKLLNLAAWNAIRSVEHLKKYYERKVNEGKAKLSAINAIRNKLVAIIMAVIRRNEPFSKDYSVQNV